MKTGYTLGNVDVKKILIGAGISMGGALLTYATQTIGNFSFGAYTPIVVALGCIIINGLRKILDGVTV